MADSDKTVDCIKHSPKTILRTNTTPRRALAEKWINEQRKHVLNRGYDDYPDENNFADNHARTATNAPVTPLKKTSARDRVSSAKQSGKRKLKRAAPKKSLRKSNSENQPNNEATVQAPGSGIMTKFRSPVVTNKRITLKNSHE